MRQHNARKMTLTKTIAAIATSVAVSGSTLIGAPAASAQPAAPAPTAASSTGARDLNSILAWFKSLFSGFSSSNGSSDSSSSGQGSSRGSSNSGSATSALSSPTSPASSTASTTDPIFTSMPTVPDAKNTTSAERPPEEPTTSAAAAPATTKVQQDKIEGLTKTAGNDPLITMTSKVIDETNQHRKSHGLGEVTLDNDLQSKAQAYADEMKSYNTSNFSDQPINYHHQPGIDHYENIMWAHNMQPGSIDPFESWKNSAAHNRAMLADVHRIGVGVAFDQNTKHFFAVMKLK
ncbi:CAP domain-containing protein [Corynebacterium matruchotii]